MHVEPHFTESELDRLIAKEKHAVRVKRLWAVRLALDGLDAPTVAERTGYSGCSGRFRLRAPVRRQYTLGNPR